MKKFKRNVSALQQSFAEALRDEPVTRKEPLVMPRIFITSPSSDPLPLPGIANQTQITNDDVDESLDPPRNTLEDRTRPDYTEEELATLADSQDGASPVDIPENDNPKSTDRLLENSENVSCHSVGPQANGDHLQNHKVLPSKEDNLSHISHDTSLSEEGTKKLSRVYEWVDDTVYDDQLKSPPPPPPDGGWGWMVLLGCCYISTFLMSMSSTFGILFRDVMLSMGVTSANVSWIFNMHIFVWNLCSVLTPPLCLHLGWRTVGLTGSFILSVAFILMSLALSPLYIFIMFSIILGASGGITSVICFMILPAYFKKRRGMSTTIFLAGISFGQMVVPLLISGLQAEYGFSGATMIHGGVLLNCCVACALFRPLKDKIPRKRRTAAQDTPASLDINGTKPVLIEVDSQLVHKKDSQQSQKRITKTRKETKSEEPPEKGIGALVSNIIMTTKTNLKGIKNIRLVLVASSMSCNLIGLVNFISFVPFAMTEAGFTMQQATFSISMSGVGSIITRILFAFIVDRESLNRRLFFLTGVAVGGACSLSFPLVLNNLALVNATLVVWGVSMAVSNSLFLVLLIEIIGMELYDSGVTVTTVMIAFTSVVFGPAIGALRDLTTSYTFSLNACGALQALAGLLLLMIPCAPRPKKRYTVAKRRSPRSH